MITCCKDCKEREIGCHAKCELYKEHLNNYLGEKKKALKPEYALSYEKIYYLNSKDKYRKKIKGWKVK